ncbi:four-carbon acid sugar kinase family protein [Sinorhizobium medicae]|uniref:Hrp-dependent type III effector protein n=2 Tax=Sinorhizobium medicae TaxID=110321 RepID=A0ABX4TIR8_9HYPH|nr:four-carbon acid sugar kinase family protein [Sinorhizobium medicae]PLU01220.1 Hrp-dependent type III effector protein [Sinorhizobium medicae]PLU16890.1 Hrp-dependent type III effector protein [Sinorhizobium medicae]PLU32124.1 Hrp-dependent type III effector protein [Sinorhizobium medicae]PLU80971.1 Hrp-dependent type III effector protein [Sinorhizobium medicae]
MTTMGSHRLLMLVILADDLTGALDSAAPFAGRGLHTEVALALESVDAALADQPEVLVVNVKSREVSPDEARMATSDVLKHVPDDARIFKKVDSRLKGNIEVELDAIRYNRALVAPAIPDFGRVVAGGHVRGFGVNAPITIAERLGRHAESALIPDTTSRDDMLAAVETGEAAGCDLMIGARGLAEALAHRMTGGAGLPLMSVPQEPILIVVGSRDPITVEQVGVLREGYAVAYFPAVGGRVQQEAGLPAEMVTVIQAVEGETPLSPSEVSVNLAASVVPAFTGRASTLLLTGGATAEAVLARLGVSRFRLLGECMPGMALAFADGRYIITKSGGFGRRDTLSDIARQILGEAR